MWLKDCSSWLRVFLFLWKEICDVAQYYYELTFLLSGYVFCYTQISLFNKNVSWKLNLCCLLLYPYLHVTFLWEQMESELYNWSSYTMPVHERKNKWRELNTMLYYTCIALYKSAVIQLLYHSFFFTRPDILDSFFYYLSRPTDPIWEKKKSSLHERSNCDGLNTYCSLMPVIFSRCYTIVYSFYTIVWIVKLTIANKYIKTWNFSSVNTVCKSKETTNTSI